MYKTYVPTLKLSHCMFLNGEIVGNELPFELPGVDSYEAARVAGEAAAADFLENGVVDWRRDLAVGWSPSATVSIDVVVVLRYCAVKEVPEMIAVGDTVTFVGDLADKSTLGKMRVTKINADDAHCATTWGSCTVPLSKLKKV